MDKVRLRLCEKVILLRSTDRGVDIVMKSFTNAKERDAEEWRLLFVQADPRFEFLGVKVPSGSKCALIEAKWAPDQKL